MDRAAQADRQTLKHFEDESALAAEAELAREIAVRDRYRRERSRYGFDRLASRVVREARQGFGRRRDALQRLRAFAVGLGLGVLGLAALGAAGLIGPKAEAPQRLWISTANSNDGASRGPAAEAPFSPNDPPAQGVTGTPCHPTSLPSAATGAASAVATSAGSTTSYPVKAGSPSAQGVTRATSHRAIARPTYLGGEPTDRTPPERLGATRPADGFSSSSHPPGARALRDSAAAPRVEQGVERRSSESTGLGAAPPSK